MRRRRIAYVTGTRADFGLMASALQRLHARPEIELSIVATGMHLSDLYGRTINEVRACGITICGEISVDLAQDSGAGMARNISVMLSGFVDVFERVRPDVVLVLGDRGEMLAGAIAAIHMNILVAHVHGGERSGTVDEPVRHAISKLSHLHFVTSVDARERLVRMGELESQIIVTGAPGIDGLREQATLDRAELCARFRLDPARRLALFVFHPVLQEVEASRREARQTLAALVRSGFQIVAVMPNSDAGSSALREVLEQYSGTAGVCMAPHISRPVFVSLMAVADLMAGNSSSGIIEAGSFGTPVINVGSRQNLRQRNANVIDVDGDTRSIDEAIGRALQIGRFSPENCYWAGGAGERIADHLATMTVSQSILSKCNAY